MKNKPSIEVREILSKCYGSTIAEKHFNNLINLKKYDEAKKYIKQEYRLNNSETNQLLDYYKYNQSFKRKLVEITVEDVIQRFEKAEENFQKVKLLNDEHAYDEALEDVYEQYIMFIGDKLVQSGVCNNDGVISISGAYFDEMFLDIRKVDQIFAIEWIKND